ncbi:hypothetical protein B0H16DRAFT_1460473 [Mycena metata]|uniref:Uncharacterized protein n=1 Tax=Mycena metata TaxID=1033252 RepID=A0AAD7NA67_9AGAR|nr:hypothetical protein B0H16DRAFT_1460473 [Mycena metata]
MATANARNWATRTLNEHPTSANRQYSQWVMPQLEQRQRSAGESHLKRRCDKCSGEGRTGIKAKGNKIKGKLTKAVAIARSEGEKPEMDKARALAPMVLPTAAGEVGGDPESYSEGVQELGVGDCRCIDLRAAVNVPVPVVVRVKAGIGYVVIDLLFGGHQPVNVAQRLCGGHVEAEGRPRGVRAGVRAGHGDRVRDEKYERAEEGAPWAQQEKQASRRRGQTRKVRREVEGTSEWWWWKKKDERHRGRCADAVKDERRRRRAVRGSGTKCWWWKKTKLVHLDEK